MPSPCKPGPGAAQPKPKVRKILDTTKVGIFAIAEGAFVLGTPPGAPGRGKKTKSPRGEIVSGRTATEVPRMTRSRLTTLAKHGTAAARKAAKELRAHGKDATPRAVAATDRGWAPRVIFDPR